MAQNHAISKEKQTNIGTFLVLRNSLWNFSYLWIVIP